VEEIITTGIVSAINTGAYLFEGVHDGPVRMVIITGGGDVGGLGRKVLYQASSQVAPAAMMGDLHPPAVGDFERILGTFQGARPSVTRE
jgi:hypothetical protein